MEKKYQDMEKKYQDMEKKYQDMEKNYQDMENMLNAISSELEASELEASELEASDKKKYTSLEKKHISLEKKHISLEKKHTLLETEHALLKTWMVRTEKENREHSEKMAKCELSKKKLETDVSGYIETNRSCDERYNFCRAEIEECVEKNNFCQEESENSKNQWLQYLRMLPDEYVCDLVANPKCISLKKNWKKDFCTDCDWVENM
jgi:chromosome segregation ATPase